MILDTAFLIDLMDGDEEAVSTATRIESSGSPQRIPAQVVYELFVGVGYTETPESEIEKIRSVVESRPVVDTTPEIAKLAGRTNGKLKRKGRTVSTGDVIVGATARHYDEPVVTGNPGDFEAIPGVTVERYE
jgi:predicted nucleic acid-binding protein